MYYVQGKHSVVVPVLNDILLKVEAYTHQKFTLNFGYNVSTYSARGYTMSFEQCHWATMWLLPLNIIQ